MTIHHLELDNRSLAYSWSHGPIRTPLVVLHGLGDSAIHTYAPIFANTTLIHSPALFIDLPGFGHANATDAYSGTIEAMRDDVLTLLETLNVGQAPIFGHSMGGNVAIAMVDRRPEIASQLIVAEPLLDSAHSVLSLNIARQTEQGFADRGFQLLTRATRMQAQRGDGAARAFVPTLAMANAISMYRAARSLLEPRDPDFSTQLRDFPKRKDMIIGDRTVLPDLEQRLAGICVHLIPNAGHSMFVEQAEKSACAMLDIVR